MELKINNKRIDQYSNFSFCLKLDSVASSFRFGLYFNPDNPDHKALLKPCAFHNVTVSHKGELLLTGKLIGHGFAASAVPELVNVCGYSKTGVLEDCEIPHDVPLQSDKLSLKEITEKILRKFGLKLVVHASVASACNAVIKTAKAGDTQKVKQFLCELAGQKHVIPTHDEHGNLVYTRLDTATQPICHFNNSAMGKTRITLDVSGQEMHSSITVRKQASTDHPNAGIATITNPYVTEYRPLVVRQSSGDDIDTKQAARNILSQELKAIKPVIELDRWDINGKIVRPGSIVSITEPKLHIYRKANFVIDEVTFTGDATRKTAVITCVLPEVYNGNTPQNIFG